MGFFHKGSGGKGVAPGDVCLSPPTPPAGPLPVPYVNMLSAGDLAKGSKSVKIQGEPTALEDASHVSTSSGDEPGNQGGGVVTHKTKGKGSFKLWSFVVKVEGKGVARHGDPMEQNTASPLPNCIDATAMVNFKAALARRGIDPSWPCPEDYDDTKRPDKTDDPSPQQVDAVKDQPCWECARDDKRIKRPRWRTERVGNRIVPNPHPKHGTNMARGKGHMTHDHQPPIVVAWYMGGCHMELDDFKKYFTRASVVRPHCEAHFRSQGSQAAAHGRLIESLK
jgi:uncharacterized Zn-binding protein involved in type VI secretion